MRLSDRAPSTRGSQLRFTCPNGCKAGGCDMQVVVSTAGGPIDFETYTHPTEVTHDPDRQGCGGRWNIENGEVTEAS